MRQFAVVRRGARHSLVAGLITLVVCSRPQYLPLQVKAPMQRVRRHTCDNPLHLHPNSSQVRASSLVARMSSWLGTGGSRS